MPTIKQKRVAKLICLQVFEVNGVLYRWRLLQGFKQYNNSAISRLNRRYACMATRESDCIDGRVGRGYVSPNIDDVVGEMKHFLANGMFSDNIP